MTTKRRSQSVSQSTTQPPSQSVVIHSVRKSLAHILSPEYKTHRRSVTFYVIFLLPYFQTKDIFILLFIFFNNVNRNIFIKVDVVI